MDKARGKRDYLSKDYTTCINGIFIIIVFISHLRGYISIHPYLEYFCSLLSQLMVAMFLFNSGYGVGISIVKKGFSPLQFLLSICAWLNLGNSNWYIFVILCLYFITFLSFLLSNIIFKNNKHISFVITIILSIILIYILYLTVPDYWYNTISAYVFGLFFALYKEKIEKITGLDKDKINIRYIIFLFVGFCLTFFIRKYAANNLFLLLSISFTFSIVMLMKFIPIKNKLLNWLGSSLFQIYILMRLPMMILIKYDYFKEHPLRYSVLSLIITIIIAILYKWCYNNISKLIKETFRRKV